MDQYESLREKLSEMDFPCKYMFKFIGKEEKLSELNPFFQDAEIKTKPSSKGTYISFTAIIIAMSADHIIDRYKSLSHINDIISL